MCIASKSKVTNDQEEKEKGFLAFLWSEEMTFEVRGTFQGPKMTPPKNGKSPVLAQYFSKRTHSM